MIGTRTNVLIKSGVDTSDLNVVDQIEFEAFIDQCLRHATELVQAYTRRTFNEETTTETLDGNNRRNLMVSYPPIITIAEIKEGDHVIDPDLYRIKRGDSRGQNSGIIEHKHHWKRGWSNIEITYTHGYANPPEDVVYVVEDMAKDVVVDALRSYKQGGADNLTMDGFGATYNPKLMLTEDRMRILDAYRLYALG